ncbi:hypothetical protein DFP73DRAFT_601843 [Morchella snyderi]|nr:hypothetical protein DFP73DRAFT_601843 [Morchella snyderi]
MPPPACWRPTHGYVYRCLWLCLPMSMATPISTSAARLRVSPSTARLCLRLPDIYVWDVDTPTAMLPAQLRLRLRLCRGSQYYVKFVDGDPLLVAPRPHRIRHVNVSAITTTSTCATACASTSANTCASNKSLPESAPSLDQTRYQIGAYQARTERPRRRLHLHHIYSVPGIKPNQAPKLSPTYSTFLLRTLFSPRASPG